LNSHDRLRSSITDLLADARVEYLAQMGAKKPNKGTTKSKSPGFEVPQQKKRLSPEHPPHEQRPAKTRATEKAADPYEFPEAGEVDLTALASITTKLGSKSGKDTVLKALKVAL
jgi:hypothetical protein